MDIIINNGAEAEVASKVTEVITFVGQNGIDGETPNLLDYVKRNELGELAFDDLIELAMLGTTIIVGGYIKTQLIDANAIRVQGNLATIDEALAQANIAAALAIADFSGDLGDLAFENIIEASKLGTTIIQGGYIKSNLLDVNAIRVAGGLALNSDVAGAISTAANALAAANAAQTAADQAIIIISGISSDNVLAAFEKPAILKEWQAIESEKPVIVLQATKYALSYASYETAFNALDTYLDPLISDITTDSAIVGTVFRQKFKDYYDAKVLLLKAVSDKAKDLADAAMEEATEARSVVDALSGSLGELAFADAISLAKLDDTIIVGGYIKTTLLDVTAIRVAGSIPTSAEVSSAISSAIAGQGLGDLAYEDLVGLAKLDTTVIVGGYLKTSLIDAEYIKTSIINAAYIEALEIVSKSIKTSETAERIEIMSATNSMKMFDADDTLRVYLSNDVDTPGITGAAIMFYMGTGGDPDETYTALGFGGLIIRNGASAITNIGAGYMSIKDIFMVGAGEILFQWGSKLRMETTAPVGLDPRLIIDGMTTGTLALALAGGGSINAKFYNGVLIAI